MTLLKVLSAVVMSAIVFGIKPVKRLIKVTFWLLFICVAFGGITFLIYILTGKNAFIYSNGIVYFDVDMTFLIVCSVVSYLAITIVSRLIDKKAPTKLEIQTEITGDKGTYSYLALMDTGNNLREPFSSYPVIIVDEDIFETLFFEDEKIRLIPVSTANGSSLMTAKRPKSVTFANTVTDKLYVAKANEKLGEYKIILNINLQGEIDNE